MNAKVFTVLGMHRSGTSCTTAMLERAGVYLGDVSRRNKFNPKGNNENRRIMNLHDELLLRNGGNWVTPPETVTWFPEYKLARDAIVREYEGVECWGFKDPRTLFTLDGWLEKFPDINLIGIFRHPHSVALSLNRRNADLSIEDGYGIWLAYNRKLIHYWERYGFPVLRFETADFLDKFSGLIDHFGLDAARRGEWESVYDVSLHHVTSSPVRMPEEVVNIFDKLRAIAS